MLKQIPEGLGPGWKLLAANPADRLYLNLGQPQRRATRMRPRTDHTQLSTAKFYVTLSFRRRRTGRPQSFWNAPARPAVMQSGASAYVLVSIDC